MAEHERITCQNCPTSCVVCSELRVVSDTVLGLHLYILPFFIVNVSDNSFAPYICTQGNLHHSHTPSGWPRTCQNCPTLRKWCGRVKKKSPSSVVPSHTKYTRALTFEIVVFWYQDVTCLKSTTECEQGVFHETTLPSAISYPVASSGP